MSPLGSKNRDRDDMSEADVTKVFHRLWKSLWINFIRKME